MKNKKGIYNIIFGLLGQIIMICLGIVIPRLVLVQYGSEVNGLLNSVSQIFIYVSLLEAGVGTASIQALYRPIAENDRNKVNGILSATNQYYKKTGTVYFIIVLFFSLTYPFIVNSQLSNLTIFCVVFLCGMTNVINFWFQGKFRLYLEAEGKNYILVSVNTCVYVLQSLIKVILLYFGASIICVQGVCFSIGLLQTIAIVLYIKKRYSWIDVNTEPDYKAIGQKKSVLIHKISSLIFSNTDMLILTVFCGLKTVSIYSMYNLIICYVNNLLGQVTSGFKYRLGQTYAIDKKEYMRLHNMYEVGNMLLVFSCFTLVYVLILPFMRLYTEGVSDINYIDSKLPVLFVFIQLLANGRSSSNNLIDYAGHFKKTQMRAVIESIINLTVSLVGVYFVGMYGVLLGTIAALLYRANDMILYTHKYILNKSPVVTYRRWIISFLAFFICIFVIEKIPLELNSYIKIFGYGSIYMIGIICVFVLIHAFFEKDVYMEYWECICRFLKRIKIKSRN